MSKKTFNKQKQTVWETKLGFKEEINKMFIQSGMLYEAESFILRKVDKKKD